MFLKVLLIRNYKKVIEELKLCKRWIINIKSLEKVVRILIEGLLLFVENIYFVIFNVLLVFFFEYIFCVFVEICVCVELMVEGGNGGF